MTVSKKAGSKCKHYKCLLIDLDDTLYRREEIPMLVRHNIERYMVEQLGISEEAVGSMTTELYYNHGTTLAGLASLGYQIDYDKFHAFVHGSLDYKNLLKPDPELRELLFSIDVPKYILTNADIKHTEICLDILGIADCFQGMFYFENVMELGRQRGVLCKEHPVLCKPNRKVFELILSELGQEAHTTLFLDDSMRNIAAAHEAGLGTVIVGKDVPVANADKAILDFHQLPRVLPELFDQPGEVKEVHGTEAGLTIAVRA